jgi:hypothetical protein
MSATSDELTLMRMAIGDTGTPPVFTDEELQLFWTDAATVHSVSTARRAVRFQVVVDALETLMADAAKRVSYKQNASTESLSDVFKHLKELHAKHQAKLAAEVAATRGAMKIGTMEKKPSRLREWPDS